MTQDRGQSSGAITAGALAACTAPATREFFADGLA
jgi:hypothetical protein